MYVNKQKLNENAIYVTSFSNELKFNLQIEKTICEIINIHTHLNKKLAIILEMFK